jgi:hypothetical protein
MIPKWYFPDSNGGQSKGIHDSGIETFRGGPFYQFLAREMVQNSLDARASVDVPVKVTFKMLEVNREDIPDIKNYERVLRSCYSFWKKDETAADFFKNAIKLIQEKNINILKVSDFNTTGLTGDDDNIESSWYNLVKCSGSSFKKKGKVGSFGIGKNAPFASSDLRTIFYSTCSEANEKAFAGVSIFVTHKNESLSDNSQPVGFLAGDRGSTIHDNDKIPAIFRREEPGTDLYILGFPRETDWSTDLKYSILENFWLSLDNNMLEVDIDGFEIKRENLPNLLKDFSTMEGFMADLYYSAYKTPTYVAEDDLQHLGKTRTFLLAGNDRCEKRILMTRGGMKIYPKTMRAAVPFCGVFICDSEEGNEILRKMEPPCHDEWDPDLPTKGTNKHIENEFTRFLRKAIQNLIPNEPAKEIELPGLSKYLPEDGDAPEENFGGGSSESETELIGKESIIPERKSRERIKPTVVLPKKDSVIDISQPDDIEDPDAPPVGPHHPNGPDNPDPQPPIRPKNRPGLVPDPTSNKTSIIPISYRCWSNDITMQLYNAVVRLINATDVKKNIYLKVYSSGEDMKYPIEVDSITVNGQPLASKDKSFEFGPLQFSDLSKINIIIKLSTPQKVALQVIAYEIK